MTWQDRHTLQQENERLRMSAVRRDLDSCYSTLQQRESDLQIRIKALSRQAVSYKQVGTCPRHQFLSRCLVFLYTTQTHKQGKNLAAARKKMIERARVQSQLDKLQNSILMIDMHRSTIEGTALDITVLEALKASGDVLRQMGATGQGLRAVEDLVSGIEESMQSAAEITTVLSSGSVTGMVNSMASYGVAVDEDELMRELDCMTLDSEGEACRMADDDEMVLPSVPSSNAGATPLPRDKMPAAVLSAQSSPLRDRMPAAAEKGAAAADDAHSLERLSSSKARVAAAAAIF
jgi:hypothetical protein